MYIELQDDATPFSIHRARSIPFVQRIPFKAALDKMLENGVITPVTSPSDLTHPMVVAEKSDGTPRICVGFTKLNCFVKRPTYLTRTPKDTIACVSGTARSFTTIDKVQGYHQIELHPDSQKLTTFITP